MISLLFEYSLALTRYEEATMLNERGSAAELQAIVERLRDITVRMRDGYLTVPATDLRLRRRLLDEIAYSAEVFGMSEFSSFVEEEITKLPPALTAEELSDLPATIATLSSLAESDSAEAFEKLRAILLLPPEERETLTPSLETIFSTITATSLAPAEASKFNIQNLTLILELIADSARLLWYELPAARPLLDQVATRLSRVIPTSPATIPLAVFLSLRALIARLLAA